MIIKSRQDDGSVVSYESDFFPTARPLDGWRVTVRMGGLDVPVTVSWCNERCLMTDGHMPIMSNGVEELRLYW